MSTRYVRSRRRVVAWATAMALITVTIAAPARAAPMTTTIRDWNLYATRALINPSIPPIQGAGQTPPVYQIHLAIVQAAVYDAVNSIDGGHEPYLRGLPAAPGSASIDAAAATAAYRVLIGLKRGFGGSALLSADTAFWLKDLYDATIAAAPGTPTQIADGQAAGAAAATAMLAKRDDDGRYATGFTFTVGTRAGQWRPTNGVNDPFAWVAGVDPFVLRHTSQYRTKGPKALRSRAYAREYNEVKRKGSAAITHTRTPAQTAVANFYFVNPVELWNRTFRAVSVARGLDAAEEARLFAMLNLASADAVLNCWTDKFRFNFWRPITAIHEGDNDRNRRTKGDPAWVPFITTMPTTPASVTPPYPDHSSGYNCVTGAFMHGARAFFGRDRMSFDVLNTVTGVTRHYRRFTAVVKDTIDARVFQGVHFRAADVQGAWIGQKVAAWLNRHYLQPVNGDDD